MLRTLLHITAASSLLIGCGTPSRSYVNDTADTSVDTAIEAAPEVAVPGELGAPCTKNEECVSGFCLSIGRCSKQCTIPGSCPSSSNWTCVAVPGRGPMCDCDVLSMTDVPCNKIDDNCDGKIDEGAPMCGDVCANFDIDPRHCGGCDKPCPGAGTPNAEPQCEGAKCKLKCAPGFGDCDMVPDNGCEADFTKSETCGKCDVKCPLGEPCVMGACKASLDVTLLLGVTGSSRMWLDQALPALETKLVPGLLALPGVNVGVSYTCEFPTMPYGGPMDFPFKGAIEPIGDAMKIAPLITGYPKTLDGGDTPDGMIEALGTLAGLPVHPTSTALTCSTGRVGGGCYHPDAKRVIVLVTDDIFHNGPDTATAGLYQPYMGITPAPQDWPAVLKAMKTEKITLLFMATAMPGATTEPTLAQYRKMLADLGQPATDVYPASGAPAAGTAADAIVARVKAIAGM